MPGLPVHHSSRSLLKLMSIELVMPSNHLILCCPLLLPPSIFPSIIGSFQMSQFFVSGGQTLKFQLQHQSLRGQQIQIMTTTFSATQMESPLTDPFFYFKCNKFHKNHWYSQYYLITVYIEVYQPR